MLIQTPTSPYTSWLYQCHRNHLRRRVSKLATLWATRNVGHWVCLCKPCQANTCCLVPGNFVSVSLVWTVWTTVAYPCAPRSAHQDHTRTCAPICGWTASSAPTIPCWRSSRWCGRWCGRWCSRRAGRRARRKRNRDGNNG